MSGPTATPVTTFWRLAGMTYLQYVTRAASAVRTAVKTPTQLNKLQAEEVFTYKAAKWDGGISAAKSEITSLKQAGHL